MADQNGPELQVKYSVSGLDEVKNANQEVVTGARKVDDQVKQSSRTFESYRDVIGKVTAIAGGAFVTAALAMGSAIATANQQVSDLDKSLKISAGTQQNYIQSQKALQDTADRYHKSIFSLAEGFNELTRETRDTSNEGDRTEQIFNRLVSVSDKLGQSSTDTTNQFTSFIDKMKQGTVDSTNLSNELDKRLYEAFVKVAQSMNVTAEELNKVLKESDDAVSSILPQLSSELENSLGQTHQDNAEELGDKIEYARSKLTILLDGLFQTSGGKSILAQAAEEAGGLLDVIDKVNREHGISAAGGALIAKGVVGVASTMTGLPLELDPFGYGAEQGAVGQRKALANSTQYTNGMPIGWNQKSTSQFKLPSEYTKADFDIAAAALQNRLEEEAKANKKLVEEAKRAAAERKRELDAISRQEIEDSKQRIRDQLQAIESESNKKYSKNHGILGAIGMLDSTGITDNYTIKGGYSGQTLTNPAADGAAPNYDHITAQINAMSQAWWNEKLAKDASSQASATAQQNLENLSTQLTEIQKQASINMFAGLGEGLGELIVNTGKIDSVAGRIGVAFGNMIAQTGKAIIAYGFTMEGMQKALAASFSNPYVAIGVGLAAVAAGSALKAAASKNQAQATKRFWTGGIYDGFDNTPVLANNREMLLTQSGQSRLLNIIEGSNSNSIRNRAISSSYGGVTKLDITLSGSMAGSDIHWANEKGQRQFNYFT